MADSAEIADELAGFALFADLTTPQLKGVAHAFEEAWFQDGERVLRQGMTGSGLYLILDGQASIGSTAQERATLVAGRVLRRGLDPAGRAAGGRRRGRRDPALPGPCRLAAVEEFLNDAPDA